MTGPEATLLWHAVESAMAEVIALGERHGLPFIAAQGDLGDPEPMADASGKPYAERMRWHDPADHYWHNRRIALDSPFLNAARLISEPFAYHDSTLICWRPAPVLERFDLRAAATGTDVVEGIIAPVHLPRGQVGVVCWFGRRPTDAADIYRDHGFELHSAAVRLIGAHAEASAKDHIPANAAHLTRREVQCLRWAAKGKTDVEIGIILDMSMSTVRFHLRNAAAKFGTSGRTQTIRHAAGLGFIGARSG